MFKSSRASGREFRMRRFFRCFAVAAAIALAGCARVAQELNFDPANSPEDVLAAVRAGDGHAAFLAYQQATTRAEQRKWICIAANLDYPEAQAEIAHLHWRPPGLMQSPFRRDAFRAYVWSAIAVHRHQPLEYMEERLGWIVTNGERWRAMLMAVSWQPDVNQCENMRASEYFNINPFEEACPQLDGVLVKAEAGDAKSAYIVYRQSLTDADRRRWLCIAANRDFREAQEEIARLHLQAGEDSHSPFGQDEFRAYVWSVIALHRRLPLEETVGRFGWVVESGERWRAMAMAVSWRPDPAQCDNMEESGYFNIPADGGL
jgi:TPR repeat protein